VIRRRRLIDERWRVYKDPAGPVGRRPKLGDVVRAISPSAVPRYVLYKVVEIKEVYGLPDLYKLSPLFHNASVFGNREVVGEEGVEIVPPLELLALAASDEPK